MIKRARLVMLATVAAVAAACGGGQKVTPPPDPFRPDPIEVVAPAAPDRTDCDVIDPSRSPSAMTWAERAPSISEAQQLAEEGVADLATARDTQDKQTYEEKMAQAVDSLISALMADPYNVHATYNLAAAYARIGRKQCTLNLLTRLIAMKSHSSRKVDVQKKFDRLLGSNNTALDPDFRDLRNDEGFRCVVANIGAATPTDCFAR